MDIILSITKETLKSKSASDYSHTNTYIKFLTDLINQFKSEEQVLRTILNLSTDLFEKLMYSDEGQQKKIMNLLDRLIKQISIKFDNSNSIEYLFVFFLFQFYNLFSIFKIISMAFP